MEEKLLNIIKKKGLFIVTDDTTFDTAINNLLEKGLIKWSIKYDDALILAN